MKFIRTATILAVALAGTTAALAHHSYASFDTGRVVDIKGTVKEFHYTNPHAWIVLESVDASGKVVEATVEANGPGYLVRAGWNRNSLKIGETVTLSINPLRTGGAGGSLVKVTFPDGHSLNVR